MVIFNLLPWKQTKLTSLFTTTLDIEQDMEIDEVCTNPTIAIVIVMEGLFK
jgi:hypothetical protein